MIKIDYIKAECRYAEKICSLVQRTGRRIASGTARMYEHLSYKTLRHESMELQNGVALVYDIMRKDL